MEQGRNNEQMPVNGVESIERLLRMHKITPEQIEETIDFLYSPDPHARPEGGAATGLNVLGEQYRETVIVRGHLKPEYGFSTNEQTLLRFILPSETEPALTITQTINKLRARGMSTPALQEIADSFHSGMGKLWARTAYPLAEIRTNARGDNASKSTAAKQPTSKESTKSQIIHRPHTQRKTPDSPIKSPESPKRVESKSPQKEATDLGDAVLKLTGLDYSKAEIASMMGIDVQAVTEAVADKTGKHS